MALAVIKAIIDSADSLIITDELPAQRNGRLKQSALNGDVYLLIQDDLAVSMDCVEEGDNVTIMGAYANVCCAIVEGLVGDLADSVNIHQIGAWTIANVRDRALGLRRR
jgi:hypothetical protein